MYNSFINNNRSSLTYAYHVPMLNNFYKIISFNPCLQHVSSNKGFKLLDL